MVQTGFCLWLTFGQNLWQCELEESVNSRVVFVGHPADIVLHSRGEVEGHPDLDNLPGLEQSGQDLLGILVRDEVEVDRMLPGKKIKIKKKFRKKKQLVLVQELNLKFFSGLNIY